VNDDLERILFQHLPRQTGNHEKPQSGELVSRSRSESGASGIQSRSANHLVWVFGCWFRNWYCF
jgi:hypothetical protein